MQPLQGLLLDQLDLDRLHIGRAAGLKKRGCISSVGLVALYVGAHVRSGQQPDLDAEAIEPAREVMGGAQASMTTSDTSRLTNQRSNWARVRRCVSTIFHCGSAIAI